MEVLFNIVIGLIYALIILIVLAYCICLISIFCIDGSESVHTIPDWNGDILDDRRAIVRVTVMPSDNDNIFNESNIENSWV